MLPAILLCAISHALPQETVDEVLPDGRVIRKTLVADGAGSPVEEGPYQVLSAGGDVLVEGEYKDGRRAGRWTFRGASGKTVAAGRFKGDRRTGAWLFSWPSGKKRATGKFKRGRMAGPWKFYEDGAAFDKVLSGELQYVEWTSKSTGMTGAGYLLDASLHGPWEVRWPDGSLCLAVTFVRDDVSGAVRLFYPDGSPGDGLFGVGTSSRELPELAFHTLDRVGDAAVPLDPAREEPGVVLRATGTWPTLEVAGDRAEVEAHLGEYFADDDARSEACKKGSLRWAFEQLRKEDWSSAAPRFDDPELEVIFDCLGEPTDPAAFRSAPALHLLRYESSFLLHSGDVFFWALGAPDGSSGHAEFQGEEISYLVRSLLGPGVPAKRSLKRSRERGKDKELAAAIQSGTAWLAAHQDSDGRWDCDGFMQHDPAGDKNDGMGEFVHDAGVTGLSLLALMGTGSTATTGPYSEAISRGVGYLLRVQNARSGLVGGRIGHAYIYDHAVATLALCRARSGCNSPSLRRAIVLAVRSIEEHRVRGGVWGYDPNASTRQDSSVTGWVVRVLDAANKLGVELEIAYVQDTTRWLDSMTDPKTGRVGYTEPGSTSSRVPGMNSQFPVDGGEALTSVALYARFVLGQDPKDSPVMKRHAALIMQRLPTWGPDDLLGDMYGWYYGSFAMARMGGRDAATWRAAVLKVLLGSQRTDKKKNAATGSWDPVGAWGFAGGRVYATAMAVLTLAI